jgi:flagellar basal-body rod protein FlgB
MAVIGADTDLLLRLMRATTQRAKVIAGNVANQNTPGYVRQTLRFEDDLREALSTGRDAEKPVEPLVVEDVLTPARPDGNNVTLEVELNAMRENRILYEAYSTILSGHFEMLRTSIKDGN